jgi:hypothetical protein
MVELEYVLEKAVRKEKDIKDVIKGRMKSESICYNAAANLILTSPAQKTEINAGGLKKM